MTVRTGLLEVKQLDRNHHHHQIRRCNIITVPTSRDLSSSRHCWGPSCQYPNTPVSTHRIFPPNPHVLLLPGRVKILVKVSAGGERSRAWCGTALVTYVSLLGLPTDPYSVLV